MSQGHQGAPFDSFLQDDGLYEEVTSTASRRVVIWQLKQEMEARGITESELAQRMHTSRSQVDRIPNGTGEGIGLGTIERAARAVGRGIRIELV